MKNLIKRLKRWLRKKELEREWQAFLYFGDREGAREVLRDMKAEGFFDGKGKTT